MYSVQTLLLNKNKFASRTIASHWVRKNGFKVTIASGNPNKEDEDFYRYSQRRPEIFIEKSFKIKKINDYYTLIIGEC